MFPIKKASLFVNRQEIISRKVCDHFRKCSGKKIISFNQFLFCSFLFWNYRKHNRNPPCEESPVCRRRSKHSGGNDPHRQHRQVHWNVTGTDDINCLITGHVHVARAGPCKRGSIYPFPGVALASFGPCQGVFMGKMLIFYYIPCPPPGGGRPLPAGWGGDWSLRTYAH